MTVEQKAYVAGSHLANLSVPLDGQPIARSELFEGGSNTGLVNVREGASTLRSGRSGCLSLRSMTEELASARRSAIEAADSVATARRRTEGALDARQRLALLMDPGTFREIGTFRIHQASGLGLEDRRPATDGVVTGWGEVHGRKVFAYAQDARILGGSLGSAHAAKIQQLQDLALSTGAPIVSINDGGGARIQEGAQTLAGYGGIFRRNAIASGAIPQISVVLGACAGGASYSPALTDFVFVVSGRSQMFLTGPDVVRAVTGENVTHEELGGATTHAAVTGVAHFLHADEHSCLEDVRYLLGQLPSSYREDPPSYTTTDRADRICAKLLDIVPADSMQSYDVLKVINEIVDESEFMEIQAEYARNIVCGLAQFDGNVVGIVASQPLYLAGALDSAASEKAARFVTMCDSFNVPLVTLVDVPGFLPGAIQEHEGVIRRGAKLLYAYCNASVPRVSVVLRKAYGGAYIVMDSASVGSDVTLAWPTNEIAVMGPEAAAKVICRRKIEQAEDPIAETGRMAAEYRRSLVHPFFAAERGLVDEVIDPADTRAAIIDALAALKGKRPIIPERKHGNPPV